MGSHTRILGRRSALLLSAMVALGILMLAGCAPEVAEDPVAPPVDPSPTVEETPSAPGEPADEPVASAFPWLDVELEDVQTGERFRISDFRGQPVLVKSFAVW